MKRFALLDQPAEMTECADGGYVRWDDVSELLAKCREIAEWHIADKDECGTLARDVVAQIDAAT